MSHPGTRALAERHVARLRQSYAELVEETAEQWASRWNAYWEKLRRHDLDVIEEACDRASDRYLDRFPTAGQLASLCKAVEIDREKIAQDAAAASRIARERRETQELVNYLRSEILPSDPEKQREYIAAGLTPYERLAREYEIESKNLKLNPNDPTPLEVHNRRHRRLMETWEEQEQIRDRVPGEDDDLGDEAPPDQPQPQPTPAVDDCPV